MEDLADAVCFGFLLALILIVLFSIMQLQQNTYLSSTRLRRPEWPEARRRPAGGGGGGAGHDDDDDDDDDDVCSGMIVGRNFFVYIISLQASPQAIGFTCTREMT